MSGHSSCDCRILLAVTALSSGGTEHQIVALATALQRLGWRVTVFSLINGPLRNDLVRAGVPVIVGEGRPESRSLGFAQLGKLIRLTIKLLWIMLSLRPTIVHFFLPTVYLLGAPLAVLTRRPIRIMSRRNLNLHRSKYLKFATHAECLLHRTMTVVLGNSRRVIDELREQEKLDPRRLGLIYNGVDMARFDSDRRELVRAQLGLNSDSLALTMVANLIAYKGHVDLLRALAMCSAGLPSDWRVFLVGRDDGIKGDLQHETEFLGIADRVIFLGSRLDVPDILQASDIGILASHQEGFSNAILEGMAAGLPMIVTDVGGNSEAVIDGKCGLVVPSQDPYALSQAILRLAGDPMLRQRLGLSARARVATNFSLTSCVERYDAMYHGLLAGRKPNDIPEISVCR